VPRAGIHPTEPMLSIANGMCGWFADTRTRFLRGLLIFSPTPGAIGEITSPARSGRCACFAFLNLTYATRNPLIGLAYAERSKMLSFATRGSEGQKLLSYVAKSRAATNLNKSSRQPFRASGD
jgi:hypothetical protein